MKRTAYVWIALALFVLIEVRPSFAQQAGEQALLSGARADVAKSLGVPASRIAFKGLKLVQDKLGTLVCGSANGKRFLVGPDGNPPPQIEGVLGAAIFNYIWAARCLGMSASEAAKVFSASRK